jgi:hypothetical protein
MDGACRKKASNKKASKWSPGRYPANAFAMERRSCHAIRL